jgi:rhamnulokinase
MSRFYVACDLGVERGRVLLANLHGDSLEVSEVRRFENRPIQDKEGLAWDIAKLYEETLEGLRSVGSYLEPVQSISCHSWGADYLLFESDGSLITPAYHHGDARTEADMKPVFSKIPWSEVYGETGTHQRAVNTLCQLKAEPSKRIGRASHLLPVADAFNYLLAGVPRVEASLAGTTQLYNPVTKNWSDRLVSALRLPPKLLPPLVPAGTELGPLRPEIAGQTGLEDARIVSSCSHELAAALAGLPVARGEVWAFLRPGRTTVFGTELPVPVINEASRDMNFTNESGFGGSVCFYKQAVGLSILEACQQSWERENQGIDLGLLSHLAGSATPFESLINPADPRFLEPQDMPLKIQAFCKETHQVVPRKPGPIYRCVLESLALFYRKLLQELEYLTGARITRLFLLGGTGNSLLNNFTANALQVPVVIAPAEAAAIGNVLVQAVALGHIKSIDEARELVHKTFKLETILPHATAWNAAYDRMTALVPEEGEAKG